MASSRNKISNNVIKIVSNLTNTQAYGIYNESRESDISINNIYIKNADPGLINYGIRSRTTAARCSIIGNTIDLYCNDADDYGWSIQGDDCVVGGNITDNVAVNFASVTSTQFNNKDIP